MHVGIGDAMLFLYRFAYLTLLYLFSVSFLAMWEHYSVLLCFALVCMIWVLVDREVIVDRKNPRQALIKVHSSSSSSIVCGASHRMGHTACERF
ncbi:hypothetical protein J3F83DRAFT_755242 [Trichoderma novae-zelandiae]